MERNRDTETQEKRGYELYGNSQGCRKREKIGKQHNSAYFAIEKAQRGRSKTKGVGNWVFGPLLPRHECLTQAEMKDIVNQLVNDNASRRFMSKVPEINISLKY